MGAPEQGRVRTASRRAAGFRTTLLPAPQHCLNRGPTLRAVPWAALRGPQLAPVGPCGSSQWGPMAHPTGIPQLIPLGPHGSSQWDSMAHPTRIPQLTHWDTTAHPTGTPWLIPPGLHHPSCSGPPPHAFWTPPVHPVVFPWLTLPCCKDHRHWAAPGAWLGWGSQRPARLDP